MDRLTLISQIKTDFKRKYSEKTYDEIGECFDQAVMDFIFLKYPSENGRPTLDEVVFDFLAVNWIKARMEDVFARDVLNVSSYSENGLSIKFDASYIEPNLVGMILPKAGVPR